MADKEAREQLRQLYWAEDSGDKTFIPAKPKVSLYSEGHVFRTCAYCRVSTGDEDQLSSIVFQQAHYKQLAEDSDSGGSCEL